MFEHAGRHHLLFAEAALLPPGAWALTASRTGPSCHYLIHSDAKLPWLREIFENRNLFGMPMGIRPCPDRADGEGRLLPKNHLTECHDSCRAFGNFFGQDFFFIVTSGRVVGDARQDGSQVGNAWARHTVRRGWKRQYRSAPSTAWPCSGSKSSSASPVICNRPPVAKSGKVSPVRGLSRMFPNVLKKRLPAKSGITRLPSPSIRTKPVRPPR